MNYYCIFSVFSCTLDALLSVFYSDNFVRVINIYILVLGIFFSGILLLEIIPRNITASQDLLIWMFAGSLEDERDVNDGLITNNQYSINLASKQISEIASEYDSELKLSSLYLTFNDFARLSKSEIVDVSPKEMVRENVLWKIPVTLEISGEFENLFNFINAVEHSEKVINISGFSISHNTGSKKLLLKLDLDVYINL